LGGYIDAKAVTEFIDSGRNVLIAGGPDIGKPTRDVRLFLLFCCLS
jgi:hypothetical protein